MFCETPQKKSAFYKEIQMVTPKEPRYKQTLLMF